MRLVQAEGTERLRYFMEIHHRRPWRKGTPSKTVQFTLKRDYISSAHLLNLIELVNGSIDYQRRPRCRELIRLTLQTGG